MIFPKAEESSLSRIWNMTCMFSTNALKSCCAPVPEGMTTTSAGDERIILDRL